MTEHREASMWQRSNLEIDGVRSAVYQVGDLACPEAVVFVHGNPGPSDDWFDLAPYLSRHARLVSADLPAFGYADHPRTFDFSIPGYARHLGALLERLNVTRAHLVLHDFGAAWGAHWALAHPQALASLTFINPLPLIPEFRWHAYASIWQTPLVGELFQLCAGHPWLVRLFMDRDNPRPFPRAFHQRLARHLDWRQKRAVLRIYRGCSDVKGTFGTLAARLGALGVDSCLIWGEADPYAPVRYAASMRVALGTAELHVLPGLGHWPFVEQPAQVGTVLASFLTRRVGLHASTRAHLK
jgi:pimeloyl-ACP methyl ester carboxylesterase